MPNKLPAEIVIYPSDRFGPEWQFTLAVPSYPNTSRLRAEGGYPEADYREALAKQGYEAGAIDRAVLDAMEAGKALPPKMTDKEWRLFQESHERAAREGYGGGLTDEEADEIFGPRQLP